MSLEKQPIVVYLSCHELESALPKLYVWGGALSERLESIPLSESHELNAGCARDELTWQNAEDGSPEKSLQLRRYRLKLSRG
jgi:hypothetical protein